MINAPRERDRLSWLSRINFLRLAPTLKGVPVISIVILVVFVFFGVFGDFIAPKDPNENYYDSIMVPPAWQEGGSMEFPLGTDELGRDVMSRLIVGCGVSLQVGIFTTILSGLVGCFIAMLSGYLGGKTDIVLMRLTDIFMSLPFFMVAIVLAAILGPSKRNIILILVTFGWAQFARVIRSQVLQIKTKDFVQLAVTSGCGTIRVLIRHIFPNVINTLIIIMTLNIGMVIIAESSLSFLGLGVPPPDPAWGTMVANGKSYISIAWWLSVWPGLAIMLVVLSFNLLGDWLRIRLDPKFRQL